MGKSKGRNDRIRYNIITILVYIIGIVLLALYVSNENKKENESKKENVK